MIENIDQKLEINKFLLWIFLILLILLIGLIYLNKKNSFLTNQIQDKKSQIEVLKDREENILRLQNDFLKIKNDIVSVTNVLPDEENVAVFVKYLEDLSSKYSLNLELAFDDRTNSQITKNNYLAANISISGIGEQVKQFWQAIENGPYFINVSSFNLGTSEGLLGINQLKMVIKIFTNIPYESTK